MPSNAEMQRESRFSRDSHIHILDKPIILDKEDDLHSALALGAWQWINLTEADLSPM